MNDNHEQSSTPASTDETQPVDAEIHKAPTKKTYERPTISRHGNLRLMTQLE